MGAVVKARVPLTQGQKFVMVVGQRSLNTSTSGLSYIGVGGGGGSLLTVGTNGQNTTGTVYTSPDGITWIGRTLP